MSFKGFRAGLLLSAFATLTFTATASAATLRGVVVQHNRHAHSFTIALKSGHLVSVHASSSPAVGGTVAVSAKKLRNGTFAARHITTRRHSRQQALIHGVVTFVSGRDREFTVSAGGASVLVHVRSSAARAAGATGGMPTVGEAVDVQVDINDQGDLEDQGVQRVGAQTANIDLEATIMSIDTSASTLTISADGEDQSGQSITVDVPPTLDIAQFQVGQQVQLTVSLQADGSYLLQGSSQDGNAAQADSPGDQQGCSGDGPGNTRSSTGTDTSGSSNSGPGGGTDG